MDRNTNKMFQCNAIIKQVGRLVEIVCYIISFLEFKM